MRKSQSLLKSVIMMASLMLMTSMLMTPVAAYSKNSCQAGSDAQCARYGPNMCCARVQYSFNGDEQDFHACANRPGIEMADGRVWD